MSFINPELYNTFSELQQQGTRTFLAENIKRIKWRGNDRILDIGSGDGKTTAEILKNFLPDDYKQLLGIDKSEQMVTYAKEHYTDDRVEFQVREFPKGLPDCYNGLFDHVFSFFALHWIMDYRKVYSQINELLSDGGDCLLLIVGHFPAYYDAYRCLAESSRWRPWIQDTHNIISMYNDSEDVVEKTSNLMQEAGFTHIEVKLITSTFKYESKEYYKNFVKAITPFDIPEEVEDELLEDFVTLTLKENIIGKDLKTKYTLIYVFGKK